MQVLHVISCVIERVNIQVRFEISNKEVLGNVTYCFFYSMQSEVESNYVYSAAQIIVIDLESAGDTLKAL